MSRTVIISLAALILVTVIGCGEFNRKNYGGIHSGMDKAAVIGILGEPTEKFANVFMYLEKNPMGNAEAHVYFNEEGKVVGNMYTNPAKPEDNSREGVLPK